MVHVRQISIREDHYLTLDGQPFRVMNTVKLHSYIRWRKVGNEGVVLNQDEGEVLVLNELGVRIVELFEQGLSLDLLHARLLAEYDVDATVLDTDINRYIDELIKANVVVWEPCDVA